jgi:transposase InsO family protein
VTHWLTTTTPRHGELKRLAACVGVSPRTLRAWRAASRTTQGENSELVERAAPRVGRPPRHACETERAQPLVRAAFEQLAVGHDGWRSVAVALERRGEAVPTRLVQELVRALKIERAQRVAERLATNRVHVEVLARDAVWGCDSTLLGRDAQGEIYGLAMHDLCARRILGVSLGRRTQGEDVVELFDATVAARGGAPLVLVVDNGGENRAAVVQQRLAAAQVVPLWNLPRTPQHNAWTERRIEDLKAAAGLLRHERRAAEAQQACGAARETTPKDLFVRLVDAWIRLDHCTPRVDFLGLTPAELDRIAPRAEPLVSRARFYADVCSALESARALHAAPRARRMAEREAVWGALERAGLVTRIRGGGACPAFKAEGVS